MKHNRTTNQPRENKMTEQKIIARAWSNESGSFVAYTDGSQIFYDAEKDMTTTSTNHFEIVFVAGRVGI